MPKSPSTIVKSYRVRVDGLDDDKVLRFLKDSCSRWLLVHHVTTTENPHYHFYAETTYSQGNFSNKIKEVLGVRGADYSNKKCDDDRKIEYYSYMFNTKKGNQPRLVSYEGFSPIDVATYKANADQIAKEFTARITQSKKTQYDVVLLVLERIKSEFEPELIYDVVIDVLKSCHMMARPHHVRDIIATVMAYSDDKKANSKVKDLTLKFFSFN